MLYKAKELPIWVLTFEDDTPEACEAKQLPIWGLTLKYDAPAICIVGQKVVGIDSVTPGMFEKISAKAKPHPASALRSTRLLRAALLLSDIHTAVPVSSGEIAEWGGVGGEELFEQIPNLSGLSEKQAIRVIEAAPVEFSLREFGNDPRFPVLSCLIDKTDPKDTLRIFGDRGGNVGVLAKLHALGEDDIINDPAEILKFMEDNDIRWEDLHSIREALKGYTDHPGEDRAVITVGLEAFYNHRPDTYLGYDVPRLHVVVYFPDCRGAMGVGGQISKLIDPRMRERFHTYGVYVDILCGSGLFCEDRMEGRMAERIPLNDLLEHLRIATCAKLQAALEILLEEQQEKIPNVSNTAPRYGFHESFAKDWEYPGMDSYDNL